MKNGEKKLTFSHLFNKNSPISHLFLHWFSYPYIYIKRSGLLKGFTWVVHDLNEGISILHCTYIVIIIGTIEPNIPKIIPSTINGVFIVKLLAPTNLIIDISLFLADIVNFIVFTIKNIVTSISANTIP